MFILGEYRSKTRTVIYSRLNPMESNGGKSYELKIVSRLRFKTPDEALRYAKDHKIFLEQHGEKIALP